MYTNGINNYAPVKEETKQNITSEQFTEDGDSFSDMMDKEKPAGNGLRETAQELAEDESILSTDEENRAMIKKRPEQTQGDKPQFAQPNDPARMLRLMDMSNTINLKMMNISKSKKELENTTFLSKDEDSEIEDITKVIEKMNIGKKDSESDVKNDDVETSINMEKHPEDFEEESRNNSQILHETAEELAEDESILSTEEENLEMARRNSVTGGLSDEDYKTTEDDMLFLNDIAALNNQMFVGESDIIKNTQNVLNVLMTQTKGIEINKISLADISSEDVDFIIDMLQRSGADTSEFFNNEDAYASVLSERFFIMLKDSIVNKKIFRIDFDNQISVIIKISTDGKLRVEFQTTDDDMEEYLRNNLYILKQKFEELNVQYEEIEYKKVKES